MSESFLFNYILKHLAVEITNSYFKQDEFCDFSTTTMDTPFEAYEIFKLWSLMYAY